ncbi:MAG TPA: rod shape-determining protein MreC [Blastocatellia bacterium]|nr:rod shape-determining protein MreC [Blastocatellia bacterium]
MSTNARQPGSEQSVLRTWIVTVLAPMVNVAGGALSYIKGGVASYVDLRNARQENLDLRERVQQLNDEANTLRERAAEYELLRRQLALPALAEYRQLSANVIARDASLWFRRLTIDRGTVDGVKLSMPVTTSGGIVGRVISVGLKWSVVQVITDKQAGVGAMLQSSRAMGELRGLDNARCEMKNISSSENVQEGESVVTTGLDRIYPKGLLVGVVERVEDDPNAPWHRLIIKPAAPVDRVEHVVVLLVEQRDLKMDENVK